MQLAYGPPGHKGVTHLMAVGDDLAPAAGPERAVKLAGGASLAVILLGALLKKPALVYVGLGGVAVAAVSCRAICAAAPVVVR